MRVIPCISLLMALGSWQTAAVATPLESGPVLDRAEALRLMALATTADAIDDAYARAGGTDRMLAIVRAERKHQLAPKPSDAAELIRVMPRSAEELSAFVELPLLDVVRDSPSLQFITDSYWRDLALALAACPPAAADFLRLVTWADGEPGETLAEWGGWLQKCAPQTFERAVRHLSPGERASIEGNEILVAGDVPCHGTAPRPGGLGR